MKIYLAGYIQTSEMKKCLEWRKRLRDHYIKEKGYNDLVFLDPLNGNIYEDIETLSETCSHGPVNSIVHRDFKCVMDADLIIANMDTFGCNRPLIGTVCELAWAWEHHKPIIMISPDELFRDHPFTKYFSSWIAESVDEIIKNDILLYFRGGTVNAEY